LIWTDKFSGDGRVWYNVRQAQESERGALGGSLFEWGRPVEAYLGSSRGPNMHFPSLGGQGRADMVGTNPTTGHVSPTPIPAFPSSSYLMYPAALKNAVLMLLGNRLGSGSISALPEATTPQAPFPTPTNRYTPPSRGFPNPAQTRPSTGSAGRAHIAGTASSGITGT
jgi:hypothetical protein